MSTLNVIYYMNIGIKTGIKNVTNFDHKGIAFLEKIKFSLNIVYFYI